MTGTLLSSVKIYTHSWTLRFPQNCGLFLQEIVIVQRYRAQVAQNCFGWGWGNSEDSDEWCGNGQIYWHASYTYLGTYKYLLAVNNY